MEDVVRRDDDDGEDVGVDIDDVTDKSNVIGMKQLMQQSMKSYFFMR
jgi:hypothetical protein